MKNPTRMSRRELIHEVCELRWSKHYLHNALVLFCPNMKQSMMDALKSKLERERRQIMALSEE